MTTERPTNLTPYGIYSEKAEVVIHVCPVVRKCYLFFTEIVRSLLTENPRKYKYVFVRQPNKEGVQVVTAKGYLVPPGDIANCRVYDIPDSLLQRGKFSKVDSCGDKGGKAEWLAAQMIENGYLYVPPLKVHSSDKELQLQGFDLMFPHIEVKMDYKGGPKELGGTGNLFIQTSEANVNKIMSNTFDG